MRGTHKHLTEAPILGILLLHHLPVDESLALAVEFYGKTNYRALRATEWFKITIVYDLPLGS